MLAAVASLTTNETMLNKVVPPDQSFSSDYAGTLDGNNFTLFVVFCLKLNVHSESDATRNANTHCDFTGKDAISSVLSNIVVLHISFGIFSKL